MGVDNMEGYKLLANAIIIQAYNDYREYPIGVTAFFKSEWYQLLSRGLIPGDAILERLEEQTHGEKSEKATIFYSN